MSTNHRPKKPHVLLATTVIGMLSACLPGADKGDGGTPKDASATPVDAATPRDASVTPEAGARDASVSKSDGSIDAGLADASPVDAAPELPDVYVPIDPIQAGSDAPALEKIAYYQDETFGPRILLRGRDTNGDIATYTVKFFNGASPVYYDIDNDVETPSVNEFTARITPVAQEAGFFVAFEPTIELAEAVDTVKIFVSDEGSRQSDELVTMRTTTPVATSKCDPNGFDRCGSGRVCVLSGTNNVCTAVSSARTSACATSLKLAPPTTTSVRGQLRSYSLWDIPPSCGSDALDQPDAVVKLTLKSAASKVVLSTEGDYTNFDTVVYLLDKGCASAPTTCAEDTCFCSDDIPSPRSPKSRLELTNLAAGDYYIVVDSAASSERQGDLYQLSVTVQ